MPLSYDPDITNKNPYYDDFDVSKGYLRALFKPGTAVQARELTQIQTMLQNQIESIGTHIFEIGAVVAGGGIGESNASFMRVDTSNPIDAASLNSMVGKTVSNGSTNAKILKAIAGSTLDNDGNQVLIFQYTSNGSFSAGQTISASDTSGITFAIAASGLSAPSIQDDAVFVSVDEGIFYVDGFFVQNSSQTIAPYSIAGITNGDGDFRYRNFSTPTAAVGFKIVRDIVDSEEDATLKDPASGFYNYNAPGADRYKVSLNLESLGFSGSVGDSTGITFDSSDFVELVRIVNGQSTKTVKYTEYAKIEETLARRTYDESGNYTVNNPKLRTTTHGAVFSPADDTKFAVGIDPNKSYVGGFEVDTQSTYYLAVDKTRTVGSVDAFKETLKTSVGNYVYVNWGSGVTGKGDGLKSQLGPAADLNNLAEYYLYESDAAKNAGDTFGSCNVRSLVVEGADAKLSLFNINLRGSTAFTDVKYLVKAGGSTGATGNWYEVLDDGAGWTGPHNADQRSLIYPVDNNRTVFRGPGYQRNSQFGSKFVVNTVTNLHLPQNVTTASKTFTGNYSLLDSDDENYVVFVGLTADSSAELLPDSAYNVTVTNAGLPNSTLNFSLTGTSTTDAAGATLSIHHPLVYNSNNMTSQDIYRTLTVTTVLAEELESSTVVRVDGVSAAEFTMKYSHIKEVTSVADYYGGADVTSSLSGFDHLDDGQRRSGIFRGKLRLPINALTAFDGIYKVNVNYTYYAHSGVGPITVDSYPDDYESIPSFVDPDSGTRYDLRSCVDFRPVQNTDNSWTNFGVPFFKNTDSLSTIGYSYYLPRIDLITLGSDRNYRVIKGVASDNPQPPVTTSEDMDLFLLKIKPYVFNINEDVTVKSIENKRFTMKEIGEIENQLDNVERDRYYEILYNDAISRANEGVGGTILEDSVLIDDFSSHAFADVVNRDHNCSIDYKNRGLKPPFEAIAVDWTNTSIPDGMTLSSDNVLTYSYTEANVLRGATGTGTLAINPYGITDFLGFVSISPKADFFYDETTNPRVLVNSFGENNQYYISTRSWGDGRRSGWGQQESEYLYHWFGAEDQDTSINEINPRERLYRSPIKKARAKLPDRITRTVNGNLVDESVVPYNRDISLSFTADGLKPDTTVYAFFDDTIVGNTSSGYVVDSNGSVSGSITLQNGQFPSGEKTFRLIDNNTNTVGTATTTAETKYYAQGLLQTKNATAVSDIPCESRRAGVKSPDIINSSYLDTVSGNYGDIQNGLDPLTQEIIVDGGAFPQGVFLSSIDLYFKESDGTLPVTIQIRPMVNGTPHEFITVPHSTVTKVVSTTSNGPNRTQGTNFSFSSPVYLPAGNWAVCIYSNSEKNVLFKSEINQPFLNTNGIANSGNISVANLTAGSSGIKVGTMFLPLNNGSRIQKDDQCVMMDVKRCFFNGGNKSAASRKAVFESDFGGITSSADAIVVSCNEQLFSSDSVFPTFTLTAPGENGNDVYNGVKINDRLNLITPYRNISTNSDVKLDIDFSATSTNVLTPVVNLDRLGSVRSHYKFTKANPADTGAVLGETGKDSSSTSTIARYISKKVDFSTTANKPRVFLDIAPRDGHVKVFIKTNDSTDDFDQQNWTQLYVDGDTNLEFFEDESSGFNPNKPLTYRFRPAGDGSTTVPNFSTYAVKIVIFGDRTKPSSSLPTIQNLRAVAAIAP